MHTSWLSSTFPFQCLLLPAALLQVLPEIRQLPISFRFIRRPEFLNKRHCKVNVDWCMCWLERSLHNSPRDHLSNPVTQFESVGCNLYYAPLYQPLFSRRIVCFVDLWECILVWFTVHQPEGRGHCLHSCGDFSLCKRKPPLFTV